MNADIFARAATRPAGFWIRAAAAGLDFVLFWVVRFSLGLVAARVGGVDAGGASAVHGLVLLFALAFTALYTTLLHAVTGQTLGKMLAGVRVVAADGSSLPPGAALLRYFGYFASAAPLGLGFAMAGLRRDKRALHDLIAGSRVERASLRRRELQVVPPMV